MAYTIKMGTVPGVYIQEVLNPELAITDQRLKTAGLIGHAKPTVDVANFKVVRDEDKSYDVIEGYTTGLVLDPADPNCIVISDYMNAKGTNIPKYILGVDYTAEPTDDGIVITWLADESGESAESGESVQAVSPARGETYLVSFTADRPESYYQPLLWDDLDSVISTYGPAYYKDENGEYVINEVTAAASLMFSNGAQEVVIRALKDTAKVPTVEITEALDQLSNIELQSIVCIPQSAAVHTLLKNHMVIDSATENGKERIAWICGAYNGIKLVDDVDFIANYAKSFQEQRIVLIAPNQVVLLMEDEDGVTSEVTAPGIYAAAALVGMTTDNTRTVAEPLTRKNPAGIYGLKDSSGKEDVFYKRSEVEKMSAAGVTVLVIRNNVVSVNQAVTTDNTNQNNREVSVVLIKDEVMKTIRYNLDREYIGHFYDRNRTPGQIKASIMRLLDDMTGTLIQDYDQSNIVVTPDSVDSTRVNVKMAFAVLRPLNYIYISFMVTL